MRLGGYGELVPERGFSRQRLDGVIVTGSAWRTHDELMVLSTLEMRGEPETPHWHVSVSRWPDRRATPEEVARVVECFALPTHEEEHQVGIARHLWCAVDPEHR